LSDPFSTAVETMNGLANKRDDYCRPFLDVLPVTGAAVSTVGEFLGSETLSASDYQAAHLDELQFDLGEGPCWDAMASARPVLEPDIRSRPNRIWPAFSEAIREDDVGSLFAFPLRVGSLRIGAVDLYSVSPMRLSDQQAQQAGVLAKILGQLVLRNALANVGRDEDGEDRSPFPRRVIHQATGMVMAQLNLPPEEARLVIQGHAFAVARPVIDVAHDIVNRELDFVSHDTGIEASE
jgi:hypothetical protein